MIFFYTITTYKSIPVSFVLDHQECYYSEISHVSIGLWYGSETVVCFLLHFITLFKYIGQNNPS